MRAATTLVTRGSGRPDMTRRSPLVPKPMPHSGGSHGMTFVEVLVATALIALVLGGLLPLLTSGQLTWEHAHRRTPMVQNSRTAVDTLTHSLRAAQEFFVLGPANIRFRYSFGDGSSPIVEFRYNASTGELEYRWDPDPFQ